MYQTTGKRFVIGIVLKYLAVLYAVRNVVEREIVGKSFFVSVIRDTNSLVV